VWDQPGKRFVSFVRASERARRSCVCSRDDVAPDRKAAVPTGSQEPAPVRTGTAGTGTGPEPEPAGTGTGTGLDNRTTGLPVQIAGLPGYQPG